MEPSLFCIRILNPLSAEVFQSFAEACLTFTPYVALRKTEAVFLDVTRGASFFSEKKLHELANHFSLEIETAYAHRTSFALAKTFYPSYSISASLKDLPLESAFCFLDPFGFEKCDLSFLSDLKKLGIFHFEDFLSFPKSKIGSRFGAQGLKLYLRASGEQEVLWQTFSPRTYIEESKPLEDDLDSLEPILFSLRSLLDSVTSKLLALNLRASQLKVLFQLRDSTREWLFSLPLSQNSTSGILPILQDKLSSDLSKRPLTSSPRTLTIQIIQTTPGYGSQRNLFHQKEQEKEQRDELVGRLSIQLGEDSIFYAHLIPRYRPEACWTKSLFHSPQTPDPYFKNSRPSRLLPTPEAITVTSPFIIHTKKTWQILSWKGPERISTEWWLKEFVNRDYYTIYTQEAFQLWIFQDLSTRQFFLHGYFD